mmetsp:Transcript_12998/g.29496  ORF Transcript_12998/g.29496 Transcript_12998/m.29496 type:complete len:495 (-) Transcript_12998:54-1538(-)
MTSAGVQFPKDAKGNRSTTAAAKKVWTTAVAGAKGSGEAAARIAQAIHEEKDWRYQYPKHLGAISGLALANKDDALGIAKAGLDALYTTLEFERDGEVMPIKDAMARFKQSKFSTGSCKGTAGGKCEKVSIPYKDETLEDAKFVEKMQAWATVGTVETSAADAVKQLVENGGAWLDLSKVYFVLLGAASEIGPLRTLLDCGANVVAVRTRKPAAWTETMRIAESSRGTLFWPEVDGTSPAAERAGCDLLTEAPEIRTWLLSVLPRDAEVVVGCYTYLDSDAHVRVSMACDAIMEELVRERRAGLAYLASPAVDCLLPKGCAEAMEANRSTAPFWLRATGASAPPVSSAGDYDLLHGYITAQGPNYALAKTLQNWRCILARNSGTVVSANIAPPARTESVMHNPTMKAALDGMGYVPPNETFDANTASAVMAWLLIHDIKNGRSSAQPTVTLAHPWTFLSDGAVHGGSWRCGFDFAGSAVLGGAVYGLGRLMPKM